MEKHTCKLCSRSFANGRALGGHMRSHMATLAPAPQAKRAAAAAPLRNGSSSASSPSSSSSSEDEEEDEGKALCYGLRENPKKSVRLVDPEFSFAVDAGSVVQDRESETESTKAAPSRRRSKRNRKSAESEPDQTKLKIEPDAEPVSSVSDTTPEEDIARCLMLLSRGTWTRASVKLRFEESDDSDELKFCSNGRPRFQCGACKKVFRSYQALGGHRASHRKTRGCIPATQISSSGVQEMESDDRNDDSPEQSKVHECPVCFKVFASGQALGGHKRSHLAGSAAVTTSAKFPFGDNLIDLNLPAPIEDDDGSQIELSAVSDAEFVN